MYNGMNFESITLGNQMQVLAISDPRFVKSSAAMAVMAGSMQNPKEHLGLAHFLEHMLFLGTKEFPNVGEYEDFLNKNGGGHNAYTSIDHTNYFFDVAHTAFTGALQRFSRFFVSPTFDPQYVEREKNAVHSEHEKNYQDDGRREHRFQQLTTDPNHPFSWFATGDKNTLAQANRDVVMDFYQKHYSANLMRLVLMSPLPVDDILELAKTHFDDVENKNLTKPQFGDNLYAHLKEPLWHRVQSVRDQQVLKLSFALPDDLSYWESKPTSFLAHLVGEEGEGSLLSYLKRKNLVSALETSTWWRMFHVRIKLTDEGMKSQEEIIKSVFSYIELYRKEGLRDYIFNERQVLSRVELDNIEPKSSMGRASGFSAALLYYPAEEFLNRYYLYHKHSHEEFKKFINCLHVDNLQITTLSPDPLSGEKEQYYGVEYMTQPLESSFRESLRQVHLLDELKYPEPNPYIPKDLSLVQEPGLSPACSELYREHTRIYSQVDTELKIPKSSITLTMISDQVQGQPLAYLKAKLFSRLKNEELNEWGYPARLAGLNFRFSFGYNSLTLETSGYSQHLPKLLSHLIYDAQHKRVLSKVEVTQEVFQRVKARYKKALLNKEHDAAYQHLMYEMGQVFSTCAIHNREIINLIDGVELEDVNQFADKFFSRVGLRVFAYGNIDVKSVKASVDQFYEHISDQGITEEQIREFENKFIQLPEIAHCLQVRGKNNNNAQVSLYPFAPWNLKDQAYVTLISKLIEQPYFTELRTQQQLGYVVAAFASVNSGFCGIGTLIQSQTHSAWDIYQRSQNFLNQLWPLMKEQVKPEDLEAIKNSVMTELRQKPNSLSERLGRFMMMAGTYHGAFDFFERMLEYVDSIDLDALKNYIAENEKRVVSGVERSHLAILYHSASHNKEEIESPGIKDIDDVNAFKASLGVHQPYKDLGAS